MTEIDYWRALTPPTNLTRHTALGKLDRDINLNGYLTNDGMAELNEDERASIAELLNDDPTWSESEEDGPWDGAGW